MDDKFLLDPSDGLIESAIEYMTNANGNGQWCDGDEVNGSTKYFATAAVAGALKRLSEFYKKTPAYTDKRTEAWMLETVSEELQERLWDFGQENL